MPRSISFSRGKGKIRHNNRDFLSANIDTKRVKDNIIIMQENLSEAYEKIFGNAVAEYNEKQKRADRIIVDYFEKLFGKHNDDIILKNDNNQQSFYEYVVGVGSMLDTALVDSVLKDGTTIKANPEAAEIAAQCLVEYMLGNEEIGVKSFSERNPNFYVFNAVIHMDEKTPHLHYDMIPFADGFKKGMSRQQSLSKALEAMRYGKGKDAIKNFTKSEREIFQKICEAHGFEIEPQKKGRGFTIPTKLMETYYPIVQENEQIISEQEKQICENEKLISEQTELLLNQNTYPKKVNTLLPPKPDPDNVNTASRISVMKYNSEVEKYNKAVEKRSKEMDKNFKYNKTADEKNKKVDDLERIREALKLEAKKLQIRQVSLDVLSHNLEREKKNYNEQLSKGIEDRIAADIRKIEIMERRTAAMQTRAAVSPAFRRKYNRIFAHSSYKEKRNRNENKSLEAEQNRYYTAKQKQIERD